MGARSVAAFVVGAWMALDACRAPAGAPPSEASATATATPTAAPEDPLAGVPAAACADGFAADGRGGCVAILPAAPCVDRLVAFLGDTVCHELAPCGDGAWGDVPVEPSTQYVDAQHAGPSDGSRARPWTTMTDAIGAAAPGAIVALAAGTYDESPDIGRGLRLWGRCPRLVTMTGTPVLGDPTGTVTVRNVTFVAGSIGVDVHSAVIVDHVLMLAGPAQAVAAPGAAVQGADGADIFLSDVVISGYTGGLAIDNGNATLARVVVRDLITLPNGAEGHALDVSTDVLASDVPASAVVRASVFEGAHEAAVSLDASRASFEGILVRDVSAEGQTGYGGFGVSAQDYLGQRPSVTIRGSVFERTRDAAISVLSSDLFVETTTVRDTAERAADGQRGIGIDVDTGGAGNSGVAIRSSLVERSRAAGVIAIADTIDVSGLLVRDTIGQPDGNFGRGIDLDTVRVVGATSPAAIRDTIVSGAREAGVVVVGKTAALARVVVRDTVPNATGTYGDGIAVQLGAVSLDAVRVERNARVGVSNFGGQITMQASLLDANKIDLVGETWLGAEPIFQDLGGNRCTAGGEDRACEALSSSLAAPQAIGR